MPTYYNYGEHNASALNDPNAGHWEDSTDWPRTFRYIPTYDGSQGYHPPAPVYQSQPQKPTMYYYAHNVSDSHLPITSLLSNRDHPAKADLEQSGNPQPTPYYSNGHYCAAPQPSTSGYYCHPSYSPASTCTCNYDSYTPSPTCSACKNSSWSNYYYFPSGGPANQPTYYFGATKAEVDAQNATIAYNTGATVPTQMAPYKPAAGQQFWCKELDGSYTLRTNSDILKGDLSPGHWEMAKSGYHFWVRTH